jgi:hypothetical protein
MRKGIYFLITIMISVQLVSCDGGNGVKMPKKFKKFWSKLDYRNYLKKVKKDSSISLSDTSNVFDSDDYDPRADTANRLLAEMEHQLQVDSALIKRTLNTKDTALLNLSAQELLNDSSIVVKKDSSTKDVKKIDSTELIALKYNLEKLSAKPIDTSAGPCKQKACKLWARVSKKDQRLYLYLDGEAVDTFKVSTGDKKHETPQFDTRVDGRMFKKYSSKKYPGGNYQGLGNMPYVVFIKGGYALHGTTIGNIKRLGTKASHGCVRLHPNNAKILFDLVQNVGPGQTWVTITND